MSNYEKVIGRNAVRETLKAGRNVNKLYISENHDSGLVSIIKMAKSKGISIQKTNNHMLDSMSGSITFRKSRYQEQGRVARTLF